MNNEEVLLNQENSFTINTEVLNREQISGFIKGYFWDKLNKVIGNTKIEGYLWGDFINHYQKYLFIVNKVAVSQNMMGEYLLHDLIKGLESTYPIHFTKVNIETLLEFIEDFNKWDIDYLFILFREQLTQEINQILFP